METISPHVAFPCDVVGYRVEGGNVVDHPQVRDEHLYVAKRPSYDGTATEYWLMVDGGYQSMIITAGSIRATTTLGWLAQAGTRPVKINGRIGGKNYPEMRFSAQTMRRVWRELVPDLPLRIA